jgi:hypothetical protein
MFTYGRFDLMLVMRHVPAQHPERKYRATIQKKVDGSNRSVTGRRLMNI